MDAVTNTKVQNTEPASHIFDALSTATSLLCFSQHAYPQVEVLLFLRRFFKAHRLHAPPVQAGRPRCRAGRWTSARRPRKRPRPPATAKRDQTASPGRAAEDSRP